MERYYHRIGQAFAVALIITLFFPWLGLGILCGLILLLIAVSCTEYNLLITAIRRRRDTELVRRADRQHAAAQAGLPYGVHGEFPPERW